MYKNNADNLFMRLLSFYIRYATFFMRAYARNQLFRRMHRTRYHIATRCIIKRGNPRGEARDLCYRSFAQPRNARKKSAAH